MSQDYIQALLTVLEPTFGVDCLLVYGSEAAGRSRPDSDLDVAALFRSRPSAAELAEIRAAAGALLGRVVDLVDLDAVSPLLAYQVLRHGQLVVDRDPSRRARFAAAVPGRREDVLRVRRPIEEHLIARINRGAQGG